MTRPTKGEDDKRTLMVYVRMTAKEKETLLFRAHAAGLTHSDFIRMKTLQAEPHIKKATPERSAFITAAAELGKIGSNVNQIARALNRKADSGEVERVPLALIEYALKGVGDLTTYLIKLLEQHGH